jgi:hypothetical protein
MYSTYFHMLQANLRHLPQLLYFSKLKTSLWRILLLHLFAVDLTIDMSPNPSQVLDSTQNSDAKHYNFGIYVQLNENNINQY